VHQWAFKLCESGYINDRTVGQNIFMGTSSLKIDKNSLQKGCPAREESVKLHLDIYNLELCTSKRLM